MQKTGMTARIATILSLFVVATIIVSLFISVTMPSSFAKYVVSVDNVVNVVVQSSDVQCEQTTAAAFIYSLIFADDGKCAEYWSDNSRKESNNESLDSTGGNYGVYVSEDVKRHFGLTDINFTFMIYHYIIRKGNGAKKLYYYDVYFVNEYVGDFSVSQIVNNVYRFDDVTDTYSRGTMGLTTKFVNVKGVNKHINCLEPNTYVAQEAVSE